MKHIKIAAGLAHVNYGRIADLVKEVSDAGVDYIHSDACLLYTSYPVYRTRRFPADHLYG